MPGPRSERGATLVEYALLVAVVALGSLGAVDLLGAAVTDGYDRTSEAVSSGGTHGSDASGGTTGGGRGPGPESADPTSTTVPPPTTTAPAAVSARFGAVASSRPTWYRWAGTAEVQISDPAGAAVVGARVEARVSVPGGPVRTITVTTGADGSATVEVGPYDIWGGVDRVEVEIVSVEADDQSWDGAGPTATITRP